MAKDEDDDDNLPPLAENTQKYLDDAKKGKPRSFLLVCKGTKVKYLAVKKKPAKKSDLSEAKKQGYKGDGYFGVITGSGKDLVFNLSMADGYTTEPVKDKSLKDFLEEHAEIKCTPTIKIVATAPDIPFDEEDLSHPLIARFMAMGEQISNVLDVRPEAEAELKKTVSEIRLLLQDGDFKAAEPRIAALATRLQVLISGGQTDSPVPPAAPPQSPQPVPPASAASPVAPLPPGAPPQPVDNDALKLKLQAALNKLVPQLKQAVANYPDKKVELLTPVAQIKKQMDTGELQEAKQGILAVGQLLKSVMAQGAAPSVSQPQAEPGNELQAQFERKLAALQPAYAQALKDMLGDTGKFRAVMAYAMEQAEAGAYGNAIKAIDRLRLAIDQATERGPKPNQAVDTTGKSFVAMQAARLRWDDTRKKVHTELVRLEKAIMDQCVAFNNTPGSTLSVDLVDLKMKSQKLYTILDKLDERLIDTLDEALNAETTALRQEKHFAAAVILQEYQGFVNSDPFLAVIDDNGFAATSVKQTFVTVLADLGNKL